MVSEKQMLFLKKTRIQVEKISYAIGVHLQVKSLQSQIISSSTTVD